MKIEYTCSNYDLAKPKFQWKAARNLLLAEKKGFINKIELLSVPNIVLSKMIMLLNRLDTERR